MDLKRYLRYMTKEMESINIRDMETSSDLEGTILDLLEVQYNLDTRELEISRPGTIWTIC